jgi:hypothetical protein
MVGIKMPLLSKVYFSPGVVVMITIFCDFCQFSPKNGVFLKKQRYDSILAKTIGRLSKKGRFFRHFLAKIFSKIVTSVPDIDLKVHRYGLIRQLTCVMICSWSLTMA